MPAAASQGVLAWVPWVFFVLVCALYAPTLQTRVGGGDSGEFALAALTRSAPHPPGYPLYMALAQPLVALPWGSAAGRLGMLSLLCAAAAAALLCAAVRRLTGSLGAALCAGSLLAFLPLQWRYAVSAEAFALNNVFVAWLVYQSVCLQQRWSPRRALATAALMGLGLSNHQILLFYVLVLLPWLLQQAWRQLPPPRRLTFVAQALALFFAGLLPYAAMPWLYRADSAYGWGTPHTLAGLLHHVLRRDYGTFRLGVAAAGEASPFWPLWRAWLTHLATQSYALALWPMLGLIRTPHRRLAGLWGAALLLYVTVFFSLANLPLSVPVHQEMQARFWLQADVIVAVLAGIGMAALLQRPTLPRWTDAGVAVCMPLVLACLALGRGDVWPKRVCQNFGTAVLRSMPPSALVLTRGEHVLGPLLYLQGCTQLRADVQVLSVDLLHAPWYVARQRHHPGRTVFPGASLAAAAQPGIFDLATFIQANLRGGRRLYQCDHNSIVDKSMRSRFDLYPVGACQEIVARGTARSWAQVNDDAQRMLLQLAPVLAEKVRAESWERVVQEHVLRGQEQVAAQLLLHGGDTDQSAQQAVQAAIALLEACAHHALPLAPSSWKNLGVAYGRLFEQTKDAAHAARMRQAFHRYLAHSNTPMDAERRRIEQVVGQAG